MNYICIWKPELVSIRSSIIKNKGCQAEVFRQFCNFLRNIASTNNIHRLVWQYRFNKNKIPVYLVSENPKVIRDEKETDKNSRHMHSTRGLAILSDPSEYAARRVYAPVEMAVLQRDDHHLKIKGTVESALSCQVREKIKQDYSEK